MKNPQKEAKLFSLAALEALRLIRHYESKYPGYCRSDILGMIQKVEGDAASLDFDAAQYLCSIVDADTATEGYLFYRNSLRSMIFKARPSWSRIIQHGRTRFINSIDQDVKDIFIAARLLTNSPSRDVVSWWDEISGQTRLLSESRKLMQGREAELLTLEYETHRMLQLGIDKRPEWVALEDNFAGYDVLSYDMVNGRVLPRLIEVKSCSTYPLSYFITRNEWDQASRTKHAYRVYLWDMNKTKDGLRIQEVEDIQSEVPSDNGSGKWRLAQISLAE